MSTSSGALQEEFRRYAQLIAPLVPATLPLPALAETDGTVPVELGVVLPLSLSGRLTETDLLRVAKLLEATAPELPVTDRLGQRRSCYRGLLVYAWAKAYELVYETIPREAFGQWEEGLRRWCEQLEADLGSMQLFDKVIPASRGDKAVGAAWAALALHIAGKIFHRDPWTDLAADAFGRLTRPQQPDGAFLAAGPSDNLESYWYHELVLLHAVASYAVQTENRAMAAYVARATNYHVRETQPDHATSQPWGLFAFIWNRDSRSLADQILHNVTVQNPTGLDGLPAILLADSLVCLRLFEG